MKRPDSYFCDVCGRQRGATNHWWIVFLERDAALAALVMMLVIRRWSAAAASDPQVKHACGRECTQKLVERWMETRSLEARTGAFA